MLGKRVMVGSFVSLLLLAGCSQGGSDGDDSSSSAAETTAEAAASPCALLAPQIVTDLAGRPLDGAEGTVSGTDIPVCKYGALVDVGIQVARVPAGQWAKSLPATVETLRSDPSVDPAILEQLQNAATLVDEGKSIPDADACGYFSRLVELQKQPPGTTRIVTFVPTAAAPETINGQQCIDGRYVSLSVGRPDVGQAPELVKKVEDVLEQLK